MKTRVIRGLKGQSLCPSCENGFVRVENGREIAICMLSRGFGRLLEITGNVTECSKYKESNTPSKWELEQQAWIIRVDAPGEIGFAKPGTREHKRLIDSD